MVKSVLIFLILRILKYWCLPFPLVFIYKEFSIAFNLENMS